MRIIISNMHIHVCFFTAVSKSNYNDYSLYLLNKSASKIAHRGPDWKSEFLEVVGYTNFFRDYLYAI